MRALARRRANQRGVGLVEMVVVTPLLLLVVFGIIEFGAAYNNKIDLNQGVREGARLASTATFVGCSGGNNTARIVSCTKERIGGDLGNDASVWVNAPTAPQVGKAVTVCAETEVSSITPIIGQFLDGKDLRSEATMRVETEDDAQPLADSAGVPAWCG